MPRRSRKKISPAKYDADGRHAQRLFFGSYTPGPLARLASTAMRFKQPPRQPGPRSASLAALAKKLSTPHGRKRRPGNQTKVPLLKLAHGLRYNGGAHHPSPLGLRQNRPSFYITDYRGVERVNYTANSWPTRPWLAHYHHRWGPSAFALSALNPVLRGTSRLTDFLGPLPLFRRSNQ